MLAFTFPGQGSQQPGMGRPWVDHPSWTLVAQASEASGRDVAALLLDADADELRRTENAQLSTYVLSLVVHDAVRALGVRCAVAAGHSLGEYTALTATGALGFDDGVRLVIARADAMHDAGLEHPGTMAAVLGLDDANHDGRLDGKEVAAIAERYQKEALPEALPQAGIEVPRAPRRVPADGVQAPVVLRTAAPPPSAPAPEPEL